LSNYIYILFCLINYSINQLNVSNTSSTINRKFICFFYIFIFKTFSIHIVKNIRFLLPLESKHMRTICFQKNESRFFFLLRNLPEELLLLVYTFMPTQILMFLNKLQYRLHHHLVMQSFVRPTKLETFIRTMVRQDNDFVLQQLLLERTTKWLQMTKYYYKELKHANYIAFLYQYATEFQATRCAQLLFPKVNVKNKGKKGMLFL